MPNYIIKKEPNPDGSRPPLQSWDSPTAPEGYALCPDALHDVFYSTTPAGFVDITIEEQVVDKIVGTVTEEVPGEDGKIKEVEKTVITDITTDVVVSMTVNQEALDAYKTEHPEPDMLDSTKNSALQALSAACNSAITDGCDVTLSDGSSGHIALTAEDQINLSTALTAVEQGAAGYPYHLDGQLCAMYPAADIQAMAVAATAHKLYHTTYYNHLAAWVRRCETVEEVQAITYGSELPADLTANMAAVLSAAGGDANV